MSIVMDVSTKCKTEKKLKKKKVRKKGKENNKNSHDKMVIIITILFQIT